MKKSYTFKPRARLLLQLGDQLIKNEKVALLELIKNSYDADANNVQIKMENIENNTKGKITIVDDGEGMDIHTIENVWMEPGTDYKHKLYDKEIRSKKYHRLPLGEKGIGRFAVHKLGDVIELVSKKKDKPEIYAHIDWTKFGEDRYLEDVPVSFEERGPEIFQGRKTGTRITVKRLRKNWTRGDFRDIYRSVNAMSSPFTKDDSFRTSIEIDNQDWIEGLMSWEELNQYALFNFYCELNGSYITKFNYEFSPWETMSKLKPRTVTEKDPYLSKKLRLYDGNQKLDLDDHKIGKIKCQGLIFDLDSKVLRMGVSDIRGFRRYLAENGGVRVYRDGMRVFDYGEPENDWLGLDLRRVNLPSLKLSRNIVISAVTLDRYNSNDLSEKTNREGFVENKAYEKFRAAIIYVLNQVELLRNQDKDKIRLIYGPTPQSEPVLSSLAELKDLVDKRVTDKSLRDEINVYLIRIEKDYNEINHKLLTGAGAGLGLSVVIHEIEKIVGELKHVIKRSGTDERIIALVKHLSELIEGYSVLIRRSDQEKWKIKELIEQAIFNIEFRLEAHKITIIKRFQHYKKNDTIKCARNLIVSSIMNIIDNSIWWFNYAKIKNKRIYIDINDSIDGFISIIIADNGIGFTLPTEEIIKPFVSSKPDGMGLGLHITDEIMKAHGGQLNFPEEGDVELPVEFKKGAVVELMFKR